MEGSEETAAAEETAAECCTMTHGQQAVHEGRVAEMLDALEKNGNGPKIAEEITAALTAGLQAKFDAQSQEIEALRSDVAALTARLNATPV